jgi:hypothetical protein
MVTDYTYYVALGDGPMRQVSKDEYVAAERAAGFYPKSRTEGQVATAGFGGNGISGKVVYNEPPSERQQLKDRIKEMTVTNACACTDLEKLRQEGHPELAYLIERMLDDQTRIKELIQFVDV